MGFVVVVGGIFIGFQLDRFYNDYLTRTREHGHLEALREDFAGNRTSLEESIRINESRITAALELREQGRKSEPTLSARELNERFATLMRLPTFDAVRRGYDNLTNTGDLAQLGDEDLRKALSEFYTVEGLSRLVQGAQESQWVTLFQPYIIGHLDYAATSRFQIWTPELTDTLRPLNDPERILAVLSSPEFENIVVAAWEIAIDLKEIHENLLRHLAEIEQLLAAA